MFFSSETFQSEGISQQLFWFNKFTFYFKYSYSALLQEEFEAADNAYCSNISLAILRPLKLRVKNPANFSHLLFMQSNCVAFCFLSLCIRILNLGTPLPRYLYTGKFCVRLKFLWANLFKTVVFKGRFATARLEVANKSIYSNFCIPRSRHTIG